MLRPELRPGLVGQLVARSNDGIVQRMVRTLSGESEGHMGGRKAAGDGVSSTARSTAEARAANSATLGTAAGEGMKRARSRLIRRMKVEVGRDALPEKNRGPPQKVVGNGCRLRESSCRLSMQGIWGSRLTCTHHLGM